MKDRLAYRELYVGLGCKKNTSFEDLFSALEKAFHKFNLNIKDIRMLASIDIKKNEAALIKLSKILNQKLILYSAEELSVVNTPNQSEFVNKVTGTFAVAESAAILSADDGKLIVPKQKFKNITIAVAVQKDINL